MLLRVPARGRAHMPVHCSVSAAAKGRPPVQPLRHWAAPPRHPAAQLVAVRHFASGPAGDDGRKPQKKRQDEEQQTGVGGRPDELARAASSEPLEMPSDPGTKMLARAHWLHTSTPP